MSKLAVGDQFPTVTVDDIDDVAVDFPAIFTRALSTVIFFYRGRW
jgi:hypothetical protein